MPYAVKTYGLMLAIAFALITSTQPGISSEPSKKADVTLVQNTATPDKAERARAIIEETLRLSRAPEIYSDLRRTLKDVYVPVLREATEGGYPGVPPPDPALAATMAKGLTLLTYAQKASDELDGALVEQRGAMISDAANLIAAHTTDAELEDMRQLLAQPATTKFFDLVYATSLLATGFNYEETRTFAEYQALIESWVKDIDIDPSQLIPGLPGGSQTPPSARKIEKAQALFTDLVKISRVEDMVVDAKRFARDVYAELAPKTPEEKQELREQIDQMEFAYTFQKSIVLAAAPPILAATLTDEQLATLHTFVRTPVFAKLFTLLHDVVRKSASFTADEIQSTQSLLNDIEKKSAGGARSKEEQERIDADWNAFSEKWSNILRNRISPETREGLISSYQALQADIKN